MTRFKIGAAMGASVGAGIGLLLGSFSIMRYAHDLTLRYGHSGHGILPTLGKIVVQSAASFGLFMGIGGLIRCDESEHINKY